MATVAHDYTFPAYAKMIHLGLAIFGIAAYLTAEFAEDGDTSLGYLLHAYLGLSLATFIAIRIIIGSFSSSTLSFKGWRPFSRQQWQLALLDFRSLLKLQIPERDHHQGLAGMTQAFGLMVFTWMAATGTGLFIVDTGGESELFELIEELHEIGETLIPLYLGLHVGAVILHTLSGNPIWKRMFARK